MSLKLCHNHTRQFTQYRAENNSDSDCTPHVTLCLLYDFLSGKLWFGSVMQCMIAKFVKCVFDYQLLFPSFFLLMPFLVYVLRYTYFASI